MRPQPVWGGRGTRWPGQDRSSSPWWHRGVTMGQPLVSGDGPGHEFSTCSSQGLLLVTLSDASWLHQTKVRASPATGGTSEHGAGVRDTTGRSREPPSSPERGSGCLLKPKGTAGERHVLAMRERARAGGAVPCPPRAAALPAPHPAPSRRPRTANSTRQPRLPLRLLLPRGIGNDTITLCKPHPRVFQHFASICLSAPPLTGSRFPVGIFLCLYCSLWQRPSPWLVPPGTAWGPTDPPGTAWGPTDPPATRGAGRTQNRSGRRKERQVRRPRVESV